MLGKPDDQLTEMKVRLAIKELQGYDFTWANNLWSEVYDAFQEAAKAVSQFLQKFTQELEENGLTLEDLMNQPTEPQEDEFNEDKDL